ncbi:MAG: hypothetical protein OEW87_12730 [Flavobacteriaceae bacterium]|nr:hypothetical protein [Flavobacteriaceae bacterium]
MKRIRLLGFITAFNLLILAACEQSEISIDKGIEGTYAGTLV